MKPIILHTLFSAKRDKLLIGLIAGVLISMFISAFLGSIALTESAEMRIVYSAMSTRLLMMVGVMIFISFHVRRLYENREMDVFLSRIKSRSSLVFAFFWSFVTVMIIGIVIACVALTILSPSRFLNIMGWGVTLLLEGYIVIAFSLFFSLSMNSATVSLLSVFGAYFVSRIIGSFVAYIHITANHSLYSILEGLLKVVSVLIPRLDLYGKTSFALYGNFENITIMICQSLVYTGLLLWATNHDFKKREF
jgi:hypothetical protein